MSATRERVHRTYPNVIVIDSGDDTTAVFIDRRVPGDPTITAGQQAALDTFNPYGDTRHSPTLTTLAFLDSLYP